MSLAQDTPMAEPLAVTLLDGEAALSAADLREWWMEALACTPNLRGIFQTPQWMRHRMQSGGQVTVAVVREQSGAVAGMFPLLRHDYPFRFDVGSRTLLELPIKAATVF